MTGCWKESLSHPFTHRRFRAHRCFYTQTLLKKDAFTHRRLYIQALLHMNAFTQRCVYSKTFFDTVAFTHKCFGRRGFYTHTHTHTHTPTEAFTRRHFCTQKLLDTETFTDRGVYTQMFFRTDLVVRQSFLHTNVFLNILLTNIILCLGTYSPGCRNIINFLTIEHHFVHYSLAQLDQIVFFARFWTIEPHFLRKGRPGQFKISIFGSFEHQTSLRTDPSHFCNRLWPLPRLKKE